MARREFTQKQKEEITERATINGIVRCEACICDLTGKKREIDHHIPEALRPAADKKNKLTIADGQLLCLDCHRGPDGKTAKDMKQIAKGRRQYNKANDLGRKKKPIQSAGFPKYEKPGRIDKSALPPLPLSRLMQSGIARTRP